MAHAKVPLGSIPLTKKKKKKQEKEMPSRIWSLCGSSFGENEPFVTFTEEER